MGFDGLKCGMRYSSRAVSEDQAIEAAKQGRPKNDRSELPWARSLGVPRVIEIRRLDFDSSATTRSYGTGVGSDHDTSTALNRDYRA
jgi:hypothetical protein